MVLENAVNESLLILKMKLSINIAKEPILLYRFNNDCQYEIWLSHIFKMPSMSNEKPSISIKIPSISTENFGFRLKYYNESQNVETNSSFPVK